MASITNRPGRAKPWIVSYRDADGKQRQAGFERRREAALFKAKTEAALAEGTWLDPKAGTVTLEDYSRTWLATRTSDPLTRAGIETKLRVHIWPGLGGTPLGKLRPSAIQAFLAGLQRAGLSHGYIGEILNVLSTCLKAAVADRVIPANPAKADSVERPKVVKRKVVPWEADRVQAVRSVLPGHYRATVDAGAGLGLRQGEVFGLALENIDFLRHQVHVKVQVRLFAGQLVLSAPKGDKERDVPLPDSVAMRLSAHLAEHPAVEVTLPWGKPGGKPRTAHLIFTTPAGDAVNRNTFNSRWREALKAAGVPADRDNGFHALRHSFASSLLRDGVDIRDLSEYLGHANPGFTLNTYVHMTRSAPDRMRAAIDRAMAGDVGRMLAAGEA